MYHALAPEGVAVKPHAAVEGEAHPLAAACKLPIRGRYWQVMRPSDVAGATGVAPPENRAHCRPGAYRLGVGADHPAGVGPFIPSTTPAGARKVPLRAKLLGYFGLS